MFPCYVKHFQYPWLRNKETKINYFLKNENTSGQTAGHTNGTQLETQLDTPLENTARHTTGTQLKS